MPRIYNYQDLLPPGWRLPESYLGDLAATAGRFFEQRQEAQKQKAALRLKERELALEEEKAKIQLTREARILGAQHEKENEHEADREAAVRGVTDLYMQRAGQQAQDNMKAAIHSPGGLIGRFGATNPKAQDALMAGQDEIRSQMQTDIELAKRMSPVAAREFLTRKRGEYHQKVITSGYQRELDDLNKAEQEGFLDPAQAKKFRETLQSAIKTGKSPGLIHERIAKVVDLHTKSRARLEAWDEADKEAIEILKDLNERARKAPDEVDPLTGKSPRAELSERLAAARVEWNRTKEGPSGANAYRTENDPQGAISTLQKIAWGAMIDQGDSGQTEFLRKQNIMLGQDVRQQKARQGAPVLGRPSGGLQNAPGAKQPSGGLRGQPKARKPPGDQSGAVREFILQKAPSVLESGGDQKARMKGLLKSVQKELGLDPTDPAVLEIVREALSEARG